MASFPIDDLKRLLDPGKNYLSVGKVYNLMIAEDRSEMIAVVGVYGDQGVRSVQCKMTWQACSAGSGVFQMPLVGDMVIVGFMEGSEELAYVLARLTTDMDKIPEGVEVGNLVFKALETKDCDIIAENINIKATMGVVLQRMDDDPMTESAVLGGHLTTLLTDLLTQVKAIATNLKGEITPAPGAPIKGAVNYVMIESEIVKIEKTIGTILSDFVKIEGNRSEE